MNARLRSTLQLWGLTIFLLVFGAALITIASLTWYVASKGGVICFGGDELRRDHDEARPAI